MFYKVIPLPCDSVSLDHIFPDCEERLILTTIITTTKSRIEVMATPIRINGKSMHFILFVGELFLKLLFFFKGLQVLRELYRILQLSFQFKKEFTNFIFLS